jgi:hypothetical protein
MVEWVTESPGQENLRLRAVQLAVELSTRKPGRAHQRNGIEILELAQDIHQFAEWKPAEGARIPPRPTRGMFARAPYGKGKGGPNYTPPQPQSHPRQPRPRPVQAVPEPPAAPTQVAVGAEDEPLMPPRPLADAFPTYDDLHPSSPSPAQPSRTTTGSKKTTSKKKTGGKKPPRSR